MSMNSKLKEYLQTFLTTELEVTDKIFTGMTEKGPSYALASKNDREIERYLDGSVDYEKNFAFKVKCSCKNDSDRVKTEGMLEDFSNWIRLQNKNENFPDLGDDIGVFKIETNNIALVGVDQSGMGLYQIQIKIKYTQEGI